MAAALINGSESVSTPSMSNITAWIFRGALIVESPFTRPERSDLSQHITCRQALQTQRMTQHHHFVAGRAPDLFLGCSPKQQPWQTQRRGQMRNPRVVSYKAIAAGELHRQFRQGQALGYPCAGGRQC